MTISYGEHGGTLLLCFVSMVVILTFTFMREHGLGLRWIDFAIGLNWRYKGEAFS